jgi:uncharacterized protein GlcG (DUF336 family)
MNQPLLGLTDDEVAYRQLDLVLSGCLRAACDELSVPVSIAIVDAAGHLVRYHRTPGAALASIGMAQAKAWTAIAFATDTDQLMELPPLAGALHRPVAQLPGGVRVIIGGVVIGAVGVGGGRPDQDVLIARAGIASAVELVGR